MKRLQSLTMTKRFNLLNAALVLLTALCIGFIVAYTLLTRQFEARQEYNQALAGLLAETSEYAVYTHQNELLEAQLARLKDLPGLAYVTYRTLKIKPWRSSGSILPTHCPAEAMERPNRSTFGACGSV